MGAIHLLSSGAGVVESSPGSGASVCAGIGGLVGGGVGEEATAVNGMDKIDPNWPSEVEIVLFAPSVASPAYRTKDPLPKPQPCKRTSGTVS